VSTNRPTERRWSTRIGGVGHQLLVLLVVVALLGLAIVLLWWG
jgi:hypothetical protein